MSRAGLSRWSLARRQAVLAAVAVFLSSTAVGITVYVICETLIREQIEQRFRTMAKERERHIELYLASESALISQVTSRTRLRQLITTIRDNLNHGDEPSSSDLDATTRILKDSVEATENLLGIDIVDQKWQVIASDNRKKFGKFIVDHHGLPQTVYGCTMTPPVRRDGQPRETYFAASMDEGSRMLGIAICRIDTAALESTLNAKSTFGPSCETFLVDLESETSRNHVFPGASNKMPASGFERIQNAGQSRLVYWTPVQFYQDSTVACTFVATLPTADAFAPLIPLRQSLVAIVLAVTALNAGLAFFSAKKTEQRLRLLVSEIADSDIEKPISVRPSDDFGFVASAFNDMSREVTSRIEALRAGAERHRSEYSRLTGEIRIAEQIQKCLYPAGPLTSQWLEVTGRSIAAENLCGDYFDYFQVGDEVIFAIGDVSGHGLGPALLMVELRGAVRGLRWDSMSLVETASRLNELLVSGSNVGSFVTFLIGRIHQKTGEMSYVGAGHRAHIVRSDGQHEELKSTGIVLGITPDATFRVRRGVLNPGDLLVATSDGIEETMSPKSELFGVDRTVNCVVKQRAEPIPTIIDSLFRETIQFRGSKKNADDCTALMLRRRSES